ncbi:hypothetical protein [Lysinibacillus endophyticus]|uniref:Uncharacterized protein n=1 Tax=Ureibacillus endophyticus TaxID=1978490 RepID=A0A494YU56_9BACL|nr:hypothetical protein [Lysinibacillus endophyticus]MCP1144499.1 hypothetical protein [Lysinibacillus endophyticus]RKQ13588.1 hypothetical protein D8M03_15715 [Lysinibacillus endophyticus]
MVIITQKSSIQLEGYSIKTEISKIVFEDLKNSGSKYIVVDQENILLKKSFFKNNKQVLNVIRYKGCFDGSHVNIEQCNDEEIRAKDKNKSIVIMLEAPHIDEYEPNVEKLTPIAPAQGQTGKKIERNIESLIHFLNLFNVIEENHEYRIIIMNAISVQTSLYHIHQKNMNNAYRELRDKVWIKMWSEIPQMKDNFLKQIASLKKNSIIINACPKSLKPFINQELLPYAERYALFESNHPSSTEIWTKSLFKIN